MKVETSGIMDSLVLGSLLESNIISELPDVCWGSQHGGTTANLKRILDLGMLPVTQ